MFVQAAELCELWYDDETGDAHIRVTIGKVRFQVHAFDLDLVMPLIKAGDLAGLRASEVCFEWEDLP